MAELSPADQQAVHALFRDGGHAKPTMPDEFRYRITRKMGTQQQTVEVPESMVPMPIKSCVTDTLE